jgi:hypothetical protein
MLLEVIPQLFLATEMSLGIEIKQPFSQLDRGRHEPSGSGNELRLRLQSAWVSLQAAVGRIVT